MIPKIIQYIWLGGEKTAIAKSAIKTWKRRAPEYKIIEWNESNLPNYPNEFYKQALLNKDYAFASDYARLKILQKYGGIYMDTDMYLLQNPSNALSNRNLVFSKQNSKLLFSTSLIASCPNQPFIDKAVDLYDHLDYKVGNNPPNTEILSPLLSSMYDFDNSTKTQNIDGVTAYNPDIFLQPSFQTVAMHIGDKSWGAHSKHDNIRIALRQHIHNRIEAGLFRIINDVGRKVIK